MSKSKVRNALDQLDPRPRSRADAGLRRAAKWSPLVAGLAVAGVFAWRYHTANDHFTTGGD